MIKRQILAIFCACFWLSACSAPEQTRTAPLDMQTVNEYNNKVYSSNTVPREQRTKNPKTVEIPLNSSDYEPKAKVMEQAKPRIILAPSIGYYHRYGYRGYHHGYWDYW